MPFPKRPELEKDGQQDEVSKGTLFDGLKSIGIATHCGGKTGLRCDSAGVGRAVSAREALVYKVQELLSIPGFKLQRQPLAISTAHRQGTG